MHFIESLPFLVLLVTPALCESPADASSILSEVSALIIQIPSVITEVGGALASDLSVLISAVDPTGVVGDVPALISTNLPVIQSYLDDVITQAIGTGVPSSIIAEISVFVSEELPVVVSEVDALISQLPSTLPLSALPGLITSNLPPLATDVEILASELIPALSSFLFSPTPTPSTLSKTYAGNKTGTATTSSKTAVFTGAAAATMGWKAEMAVVGGFAAIVAFL